jgi:hypothetical protein
MDPRPRQDTPGRPTPGGRPAVLPLGPAGYGAALDHSEVARITSRGLLLVGGVIYLLWHFLHKMLMPEAVDPLWERAAFLAFVIGVLALSFRPRLQAHLLVLSYVVVVVGTTHYFTLVMRNQIAVPYLVGVFVVLASVNMLMSSVRAILGFSAYVVALALAAVALDSASPFTARLQLVVGVSTVQLALAVTSWRNVAIAGAARELDRARREVNRLRGLLPICMQCNRIRTEKNDWQPLEAYVESHTGAAFTHSLCTECLERHYPE